MTFDFGGFFGGIVGTIGAFGVALYTIKYQEKQSRPKLQKSKYEIASKMETFFDGMVVEIIFNDFKDLDSAIWEVHKLVEKLEELFPETLEAGYHFSKMIADVKKGINAINTDFKEYRQKKVSDDEEQILIREYVSRSSDVIESPRQECKKILEKLFNEPS